MTPSDRDRFHLRLLGVPRAEHQGRELRFPDRKCVALLAVLALDGRSTRARMATLLWEEQGDADARRNLRRELHRLRDAGFEALLASEGDTLALSPAVEVDVAQFRAAHAAGHAERALQSHGGRLLEGDFRPGGTGHAGPAGHARFGPRYATGEVCEPSIRNQYPPTIQSRLSSNALPRNCSSSEY